MATDNYPFIMTPSVNKDIQARFDPHFSNGTAPYCWAVHILSLAIASICLGIGIGARLLRKKRRIEFSHTLEKYMILSIVIVDALLLFIYILGNLYIQNIYSGIKSCYEHYYAPENNQMCMELCQNPDT